MNKPSILAPAGDKEAFLAAIAAGADAVYCGLKNFSARMEAENFTLEQLKGLTELAHEQNVKVFAAFNTILKQDEIKEAGRLISTLEKNVGIDAIIMQDPGVIEIAKAAGFSGKLHLSTLAGVLNPKALQQIGRFNIDTVVLPRELNIDEIKMLADACPPKVSLELFIHGALCYGISGRCYWSSFLGGKGSLRGRCVQPCRRVYTQGDKKGRFFSCMDLGLDVLTKVLLPISKIKTWKIEGRKKSAHYVYCVVTAYRLLRDYSMKQEAISLLDQALGRQRTHFNFLPQRPWNPIKHDGRTASGMLIGTAKGRADALFVSPRIPLLKGDKLRVGYEDEKIHTIIRVGRYVPKNGRLYIKIPKNKAVKEDYKSQVFLIDRRDEELIKKVDELSKKLNENRKISLSSFNFTPKSVPVKRSKCIELDIYTVSPRKKGGYGLWLSKEALDSVPAGLSSEILWWLPPVIWPNQEKKIADMIKTLKKRGAAKFVINSLFQASMLEDIEQKEFWAGPFCNLSNPLSLKIMKSIGASGAIVSPELGEKDYMNLPRQSPFPLGFVLYGDWPLCISRIRPEIKQNTIFKSPKGEGASVVSRDGNFWVYPEWRLDFRRKKDMLCKAGYQLFINLIDFDSRCLKKREGVFNWNNGLI